MLALASSRALAFPNIIELLRSVDRLLRLEANHGKAIERLGQEIDNLKERVTRLETREDIVIVEARAAAGTAASQVAIASVSDLAVRIGRLKAQRGQGRLEAPE